MLWLYKLLPLLANERGGGGEPSPPVVYPAPEPPNVAKTAGESYEAQLKYNPLLTQQNLDIQKQFAPQFAQSQYDVTAQYSPLYRALVEQNFPQIKTLSEQTMQGLTSPTGLNTQQQAAQDAIRQRAYEQSAKGIRESANVGGTLYGGRRELREDRARNELAQGFAAEDITRQQQQRAQTMQELLSLFQLAGFNVQQPNVPQYTQGVIPGGNELYQALVQNAGNYAITSGIPGTPGFGSTFAPTIGF